MIEIPETAEGERSAVHVSESELAGLRARLDYVRLPESGTVPGVSQVVGLRRLVVLPHYRVLLDGLGMALWRVRSPEPDALPLLTDGRPGSVLEFEDVLGCPQFAAHRGGPGRLREH